MAHGIRAQYGKHATRKQMQANIDLAIGWAAYLREQLPDSVIYCPGDFEDLFQQAYLEGLITSEQILEQSKAIVRLCDVVLILTDPEYSEGVRQEIIEADRCNLIIIPLFTVAQDYWANAIDIGLDDFPQMQFRKPIGP